jgi:exodeoxyribonuclease VII small subunit
MPADAPDESAPPSFEQALTRLEGIVRDLEEGQLGLADSLARYETGVGLLKDCHQLLERAERKIELLSGVDAEGNPISTPFDDTATDDEGQQRSRKRTAGNNRTKAERPKPKGSDPPQIDEPPALF